MWVLGFYGCVSVGDFEGLGLLGFQGFCVFRSSKGMLFWGVLRVQGFYGNIVSGFGGLRALGV